MNKKGGSKTLLNSIIGIVIGILAIIAILNLVPIIIPSFQQGDQSLIYFEELYEKLNSENLEESQIINLEEKEIIVYFKEGTRRINLKSQIGSEGQFILKNPCENCICLCKTKNKNTLVEEDCLDGKDICETHEKDIKKGEELFYLFSPEVTKLKIEKNDNYVNIV